ncbi:hypothetical protein B0H16DRAFT_1466709 [Mycena metata]|uniref:Uncharacterized protein n=1 Tax=Mycena metata TaxID=1033252 RepID=A0AAD7I6M1_9AGAR|nr:hypothetical protein B0H16DRAFT_1466709 [Mycena metata]
MAHSDFSVRGVGVERVRKKVNRILNIPEMPEDLDKPCNGTRSMGNSNQKINSPATIVLRVAPKAKISPTKPLISIEFRPIKELNQLTGGWSSDSVVFLTTGHLIEPTKLRVGKHKGDAKACKGKDPQEIVLEMIVWIHVDYESN